MSGKCSYWHIYSDGQKIDFLFRDESEFIAGMNRIAFCILVSGVKVHAFCLMSNHIHILISGTAESARKFINEYKRMTGIWIRKNGFEPLAGDFDVSMKEVDSPEYLLTTIAYIHRNPMVAGFQYRIECYPWSSASLYFSSKPSGTDNQTEKWLPASSIGQLRMRELIRSHIRIPGEWLVDLKGMICPASYLSYRSIEQKFSTQRHYFYVLSRKSELEINQSLSENNRIMLSDSEVRSIILEMASKEYTVTRIMDLGTSDRLRLASNLRSRYGIPIKQLGRILRITEKTLRNFI